MLAIDGKVPDLLVECISRDATLKEPGRARNGRDQRLDPATRQTFSYRQSLVSLRQAVSDFFDEWRGKHAIQNGGLFTTTQ